MSPASNGSIHKLAFFIQPALQKQTLIGRPAVREGPSPHVTIHVGPSLFPIVPQATIKTY